MTLKPHQKKASKQLNKRLKKYGYALLSGEPRSGKTLSFLKTAKRYDSVLIVTQKEALAGINTQARAIDCTLSTSGAEVGVTVTNYHQVKNLPKKKWDLIVLDEAHRWIGGYPKPSRIWKDLKEISSSSDVIYSSGTLSPEGYANLYPMLAVGDHSPWRDWKRFTLWFEDYGTPYSIRINGYDVAQYDRIHEDKIFGDIEHLIVTITNEEAGHKYIAKDKIHGVELTKKQKKFITKMRSDLFVENKNGLFLGDTPAKLGQKLHQVAGGFVKGELDDLHEFKMKPKIDYIKANFDPEETIILAYFIHEQKELEKHFPHTGSIKKNSEGVDYSHFRNLVLYSMPYDSATYQQVRVRQMNLARKWEVTPHFLIAGDVDQRVYDIATGKQPYTRRWYE